MSAPTLAEMRQWTADLRPDVPLDVDVPADEARYVQLAESGRAEVDVLQTTIRLSLSATAQLLTGPSGSGKTTELLRLRRDLRAQGYRATVVAITDYVSESSPLDVTEFLVALAVGTHDALVTDGHVEADRPGFAHRLGALLGRLNLDLDIAGVKLGLSGAGVEVATLGQSATLSLADEIKSSRPFVEQLRSRLANHLKPLYDEVAAYLRELVPDPAGTGLSVLIVDGLEKLRGTSAADREVQQSIEALFVNHAAKLRFPSHHVVYTVPTYLQFLSPGALPFDARLYVPVPHLRARLGGADSGARENLGELREVVARRIPVDLIFGATGSLDAVLFASGGHLRDIFRILQHAVNLTARLGLDLPLLPAHVDEAITMLARDFAAMTSEQAEFLRHVHDAAGLVRPDDATVQLMARLLQNHMLLAHRNGDDWYEVHPLACRALGLA